MKNICIIIFALIFFFSCNKHRETDISNHKNVIVKDSCFDGFIIIQYRGDIDHPVKSLLIRTNKKDTAFLSYIANERPMRDSSSRKFELNEIISTKNEFEVIRNYIIMHNTQKKKVCVNNSFNPQEIILIDRCDSLDYIVDRKDKMYFHNLVDIIQKNKLLRKYLEYSRRVQEQ
jgi:hypothetical protein